MSHHDDSDLEAAELATEIEQLRTELDRLQALHRPFALEGRLVQDSYEEDDGTITIHGRIFTEHGVWRAEQIERRMPGAGRWCSVLVWPERSKETTSAG